MSVYFYQTARRHMPDDNYLHHKHTHTHTSWCVDSCFHGITFVALAHVTEEALKVCGHYIPPLRMKSPVNLTVPCLKRTAKVARPVLRFRSFVVFVRNAWELFFLLTNIFKIGGHDGVVHVFASVKNTWTMRLAGHTARMGEKKKFIQDFVARN